MSHRDRPVRGSQCPTAPPPGCHPPFGMPVVFLWLLTGRFTKFRKSLVLVAFFVYLIIAPCCRPFESSVCTAATGVDRGPRIDWSVFRRLLNYEMAHFVFRVGGTDSLLFAIQHTDGLSVSTGDACVPPGRAHQPFTHDVVGLPVSATLPQAWRRPCRHGNDGRGCHRSRLLVLALTVLGLDVAWRWIAGLWDMAGGVGDLAAASGRVLLRGRPGPLYKSSPHHRRHRDPLPLAIPRLPAAPDHSPVVS